MKSDFPIVLLDSIAHRFPVQRWMGCLIAVAGLTFLAPHVVRAQTDEPAYEELLKSPESWVRVEPSGANAAFKMPIKPRYVERIFSPIPDEPPIKVRMHLATIGKSAFTSVFSYHELHEEPATQAKIDRTLDGAVNGSVVNVMGQLVAPEELGVDANPIPIDKKMYGHDGRQYVCRFIQKGTIYIVTARIFLVGKRLYQLNCIIPEDAYDADPEGTVNLAGSFINSFELVEPENDLPPRPRPRVRN